MTSTSPSGTPGAGRSSNPAAVVGVIIFVMLALAPIAATETIDGSLRTHSIVDRALGWLLALPVGLAYGAPVVLVARLLLRRSRGWVVVAMHAALFCPFTGHAIVECLDILPDDSPPEACAVTVESVYRPKKGSGSLDVSRTSADERWTIDLGFARSDTRPGDVLAVRLHRGALRLRWIDRDPGR